MSESQERNQSVSESQFDQAKERLELEQCEQAFVVYEHAINEWTQKELTEKDEKFLQDRAKARASAVPGDGVRLGMPGYMNCKLQFISHYDEQDREEKFFRISPNGADGTEESKSDFLKWQDYVRVRFEKNGLPFRPY